jgi:hypothetical protein
VVPTAGGGAVGGGGAVDGDAVRAAAFAAANDFFNAMLCIFKFDMMPFNFCEAAFSLANCDVNASICRFSSPLISTGPGGLFSWTAECNFSRCITRIPDNAVSSAATRVIMIKEIVMIKYLR